jgi:hypothetical protein
LTIRNAGAATTTLSAIVIDAGDRGDFIPDTSDCMIVQGGQLGPGASCTVDVTFRPTSAGPHAARLRVISTNGGTPTTSLTGRGNA